MRSPAPGKKRAKAKPECPFLSEAKGMLDKHLCDYRAATAARTPAKPSPPPGYVELTAHETMRRGMGR